MSTSNDERQLVAALQAGDQTACDELVRRYYDTVYRMALQMTGQPELAEDLLQETFMRACQSATAFRGEARLITWLFRIARNSGLQWKRKRRPETISLDEALDDDLDERPLGDLIADLRHLPEQRLLSQELLTVIDEAIAALPDTLRQVFILREFEGRSTAEVARRLGISESAVKVRLHRARKRIRDAVQTYLADEA